MRTTKLTVLTVLAMAALVATAGPLAAGFTYGCTLPMIPEPDELSGKTFDARGLVMFIQENGLIDVKSAEQETLAVRPEFAILVPGEREPVASGKGDVVKVEVGRQPIARASDDIFPHVAEAMNAESVRSYVEGTSDLQNAPRADPRVPWRFTIHSVRTMEHGEALRFPRERGIVALTLEFTNARPAEGDEVNSHKLVMFIKPYVPER